MKLYWIHKLKNGDLELHAFNGHHIENESNRFEESAEDAINNYREHLERRLTKCRDDIKNIKIEVANLNGLEMEVDDDIQ